MVTLQHRSIVAALLIAASAAAHSQSTASPQPGPAAVPGYAANPPAPPGNTAAPYTFPNSHRQFSNYLYSTFGPPAFIASAIGAGLDQRKPAPPEWDSGAQGYAERYGWRFGMQLVTQTTAYSLGALIHEDVAYHRCVCAGLLPERPTRSSLPSPREPAAVEPSFLFRHWYRPTRDHLPR